MTDHETIEFAGSIPEVYDNHLVPILFEPYALDLSRRVRDMEAASVLEVAAGSGVVTRALARTTDAGTSLVATDLSQAMLDQGIAVGTKRDVEWRQADATDLPFDDDGFDVVMSQFGMMFLPDKAQGFAEARRVLRPGGSLVFSVWDALDANGFSLAVHEVLAATFPDDPPRFLIDGAFGYHDEARIRADLARGGFGADVAFEAVELESRSSSAEAAAIAFCQGGPVRTEVERRDPMGLASVTDKVADVLRQRYGSAEVVAPMRAHVISVVAA